MSLSLPSRRLANVLGFTVCAVMLAYALYAQHVLGLDPCPLCIFQRVAVIAMGLAFAAAALHNPGNRGARFYGVLTAAIAILGIAIAARHVWIQAQPAGSVPACGAGLSYMLEILPLREVVGKVLAGSGECAKIEWAMLGLSMPWWVLIALLGLGSWALIVNLAASRTRR